jgi:hypothetical protein
VIDTYVPVCRSAAAIRNEQNQSGQRQTAGRLPGEPLDQAGQWRAADRSGRTEAHANVIGDTPEELSCDRGAVTVTEVAVG